VIKDLPLLRYEGAIVLVDTAEQLRKALNEIERYDKIGFDTEAKPAFSKGQYNPVSLLQIATEDQVYLIRLNKTGFTQRLARLFSNKDILKIGISIRDDIKDLQYLRQFTPESIMELNTVAGELQIEQQGVRNLSAIFLNGRVSKNQQVTNWENERLTPSQQVYAATDAWVCYAIHTLLDSKGYL
ncbi:MAG: 3'-5' exonuclease, partial [Bacteroidota bacterium]